MENEIIKIVISNGIFCSLFVWLLIDTRKDTKQREGKYQEIITSLSDKIGIIDVIKEDIKSIKTDVDYLKHKE